MPSQAGYPDFDDVFFLSRDVGWVTTWNLANYEVDILRTLDGGDTWEPMSQTTRDLHAGSGALVQFLTADRGWLSTFTFVGQSVDLRFTEDGGANWTSVGAYSDPIRQGVPAAPVFADTLHGIAASSLVENRALVHVTGDGGQTWSEQGLDSPDVDAAKYRASERPFFLGDDGVIPVFYGAPKDTTIIFYRTSDAGATWVPSPPRHAFNPSAVAADAATWWLLDGKDTGQIHAQVTADAGASWADIPTDLPMGGTNIAVLPVDDQRALAQVRGDVYVTSDGGHHWERVTVP